MAILPRHNSSTSLNSLPASTLIDVEGAKSKGRNIAAIGGAVGDLASTWQNAINHEKITETQNNVDVTVNSISTEADEDNNIENSQAYHDKLKALRAAALEGFSDNIAKKNYEVLLDKQLAAEGIKIDSMFRKKLLNKHEASRILQSDINREKYFETGNEAHLEAQHNNIKNDYDLGFIDEKIAATETVKVNKWKNERVSNSTVREALVKKQIKENQVAKELEVLQGFAKDGLNNLRVDDVVSMMGAEENGEIRTKFGEALIGYMVDPDVYSTEAYDNPAFATYMKAVLDSKDKQTVTNVLTDALNKKNVAKSELDIMILLSIEKSGALVAVDKDSGDKPDAKPGMIQALKSWFSGVGKNKDKGEENQGAKEIVTEIKAGKPPAEALRIAESKAMLKKYPIIGTYPKEGKVIPDKYGNKIRWFPDGRGVPE